MRRIYLVVCLGVAGCDARSLHGVDGGVPDALDAAETSAVCSSPSICNDDPQLSTLAGTCTPFGEYWYCTCNEGFSINPKTQRCRAGSMCVAAGADPWGTNVTFDTSACAQRPVRDCASQTPGASHPTVAQELYRIARNECLLPPHLYVRVVYEAGCVVSLQTDDTAGKPWLADFVACLTKALQTGRWSCPEDTGCVLLEWDTLAP